MPSLSQRLSAYFGGTGAKLIKIGAAMVAALLVFFAIRAGVEKWQAGKYEKHVQAMEQQVKDAEAKAQEAEQQASAIERILDAKQSELRDLQARADAAETNLRNARRSVTPLKEAYENTRNAPVSFTPISVADACIQLAELGHACQ